MPFLREVNGGVELSVTIRPNAKKEGFLGEHAGKLKIAVNAPPIDGRANSAVIALLSSLLNISKKNIEIRRGESSKTKLIVIRNISLQSFQERLKLTLPPP